MGLAACGLRAIVQNPIPLGRAEVVNRTSINPHCASDGNPVHRDIRVREITAQEDLPEKCVAEDIQIVRLNSLEKFNRCCRNESRWAEYERSLTRQKESDEPIDRRGPEERSAVLDDGWWQTNWNKPTDESDRNQQQNDCCTQPPSPRGPLQFVRESYHCGWTTLPAARSQARHMYQLAIDRHGFHFLPRRSICSRVASKSGVTFCVGLRPRNVSAKPLRTP